MKLLIKNAQIINEGTIKAGDILVKDGLIDKIGTDLSDPTAKVIDANGTHLMPGVIDDQVHFREPGLTHKACIETEARAAVAGGTTSFMEMPNTVPNTLNKSLLEDKYEIARQTALANYSFFMGASNDNIEDVLKTDVKNVCGVKVFMGSSTGNMLVDNEKTLENIFSNSPMLIATHCEDEATVRANTQKYLEKYGKNILMSAHPEIRDVEACIKSSRMAIELAKKHDARLHILHISTGEETKLFGNDKPLAEKRITSEVCVHHLWFDKTHYESLGSQIKCNPAIKDPHHKPVLLQALLDDKLDIIATDHAPHTWDEKQNLYGKAPSGVPLVQHALLMMLEFYKQGKISLEKLVEKMTHAPAICFEIHKRGYIREGYFADLVLFDLNKSYAVSKDNVQYRCGWSPFEGHQFSSAVTHTIVSGHLAYENGKFYESQKGQRLTFDR